MADDNSEHALTPATLGHGPAEQDLDPIAAGGRARPPVLPGATIAPDADTPGEAHATDTDSDIDRVARRPRVDPRASPPFAHG